MNFKKAVKIIIDLEGNYSNDPDDPGGETKWGISKYAYPNLDIKNLSQRHAEHIYEKDYWNYLKCEILPCFLRLSVFDCAVNQGPHNATKFLQSTLGVKVDGIFGNKTIDAAKLADQETLINFSRKRLAHYWTRGQFEKYGKGWTHRLLKISILSCTE